MDKIKELEARIEKLELRIKQLEALLRAAVPLRVIGRPLKEGEVFVPSVEG